MKKTIILFLVIGTLPLTYLTDCSDSDRNNPDYRNSDRNRINQRDDTTALTKHWEKAIPHQEIPEGLESISAKSCGSCHREVYDEWKQSTHSVAYKDLQFRAEMKKDNILTCLNCHTPLQNQQEFIVKGIVNGDYRKPWKVPNPQFDETLQLEGITCATCHVRNGSVIGTSGTDKAPHKTVKDIEFLSEELCVGCHNVADKIDPALVCSFETGDEWINNWATKRGLNCITCHMPQTQRNTAADMSSASLHSHNFPGSGIPKFFDMKVKRLEGLEISEDDIKPDFTVGERLSYVLKVKNKFAGHSVPTGDPERFILITFRLTDSEGNILKKKNYRIGEKWQWHPVARKLFDNNLKPLEERPYKFEYIIREKGAMTLSIEITKHRMTEKNAEYDGILGEYPLFIETFKKNIQLLAD